VAILPWIQAHVTKPSEHAETSWGGSCDRTIWRSDRREHVCFCLGHVSRRVPHF